VIAVIAVGGAVAYFVVIAPPDDETVEIVEPEDTKEAKSTIPDELKHLDGNLVTLSAREQVEIFYKGQTIGKTPMRLNLRPGTYEVEIEGSDGRKKHTFEVSDKALQTIQLRD